MCCVVHGPQAIDRDMRINLSGIQTRMTKQRLQRADTEHQHHPRRSHWKIRLYLENQLANQLDASKAARKASNTTPVQRLAMGRA